ncbi:sulfite exporter TauE/SafE family protein [Aliagarivorans marinus]|uniref:sulfite exporter TauE/SafE family protein n=1 Tax=Aliagarivorans marinus TaxID=561965 RepID=UPI00042847FB|nr:sulfite exporter TauE/SafE family protein [Aliagarivorans marinus]
MEFTALFAELIAAEALMLKLFLGGIFGLCLGLTGVGGGVLLIPMLQRCCDMPPVLAVGTASLIATMVKVNASIAHVKAKNVSWKTVSMLFVGALPLTYSVTQLVVYFNSHHLYANITQQVVTTLILLIMVVSLISVLLKSRKNKTQSLIHIEQPLASKKALLSGVFCGSIIGSTGVGGGVLLIPILNSVLNVNIKKSIGSSVILALFLSGVTALGYAKGGQTDVTTALIFLTGSFLGVPVASHLMKKLSDNSIYKITISVIFVSLLFYTLT